VSEEVVFNEMVPIPENIGFEETLVGPLTKIQVAKLFFPAIIGIGASYAFHLPTMLKFAVAGVCLLIGAVFAFIKPGGVPLEKTFVNWLSYRARPRQVYAGGQSDNPLGRQQSKAFVDVEDIRGPTVRMPGELYARIVEARGINFAFMSSAERANVIAGYEQFLNSIEKGVQIVARPEKFNPREYLQMVNDRLEEAEGKDTGLEAALSDYMVFFNRLAQGIIEHRIYVVVYTNLRFDAKTLFEMPPTEDQKYAKANDILDLRAGNVMCGLGMMNIGASELEGSECRALFARYYGGGL